MVDAIQPHGVLFAFDRELRLAAASANAAASCAGVQVVQLADLGRAVSDAVAAIIADAHFETVPIVTTIGDRRWFATVHRGDHHAIVELEATATDDEASASITERTVDRLQQSTDIEAMLEIATFGIRRLCGFAEVAVQRVRSFDDAPTLVVDAAAPSVPLEPAVHPQLDLRRAALRSPSEDDALYLVRIGARASLTLHVRCDGRPWAIIACRHPSARWVSPEIRAACRIVVQTLGLVVERAEARALEKQRNLFIGIVGHDLRSPLNAISLAAELVSGPVLDRATLARVGDRLGSATQRMRHMVDQLLDYSRVQSGLGLGIQTATVDVHALARSIVAESRGGTPGADISLRVSGPHEADVDGDRIGQLLANLLSNARHHGTASSPIDVEITGDDRNLTIHVRNSGPAIPAELLPRLFDPYKPQSLRKHGNRGGLGLGLHIVKQIVEGHRGTIDVASANDETRVVVELPRTRGVR